MFFMFQRLVFDHAVYHPLVDPSTHEMDVQVSDKLAGHSNKTKIIICPHELYFNITLELFMLI